MSDEVRAGAAQGVYRLVLVFGLLFVLAANLPGHLSVDSVTQLIEGRTGDYRSFNPRLMSWLLGRADAVIPGASLFVALNTALLFASLWAVPQLVSRFSWLAIPVGVAVIATPQVLVYQGVVWKDVFFANLAIAGFVCLALAMRDWRVARRRLLFLATAVLLLALASQVRQNGAIAVLLAAVAAAFAMPRAGAVARIRLALILLVAPLLIGFAATAAIPPSADRPPINVGLRVLQHYDIYGAAAVSPEVSLRELEKVDPQLDDRIRADAARHYSPQRVDTLASAASLPELWGLDPAVPPQQWTDLISGHPLTYLEHRWAAFRWVLLTPELDACLPVAVGVDAQPERLAVLEIPAVQDPQDRVLRAYAASFFETPIYSHLTYGAVALALTGFLLYRRRAVDWLVAGLLLSAVGFAASFFVISIACDYRYLYFLDLAALFGLVYVAAEPTFRRERRDQ